MDPATVYALVIAADFVYHRWLTSDPPVTPPDKVTVPAAQSGAIVPLAWGRVRINKPFLAWAGAPSSVLCADVARFNTRTGYLYMLDQFFNVAIGFDGGKHGLKSMWVGDVEMGQNGDPDSLGFSVLDGNGGGGDPDGGEMFVTDQDDAIIGQDVVEGNVEFLNGNASQVLVSGSSGVRWVGSAMIAAGIDPTLISGFRGYISTFLFHRYDPAHGIGLGTPSWVFGTSSSLPTFSFEIATYADNSRSIGQAIRDIYGTGFDANPIDVIYDILTGLFGKLALPASRIDMVSFQKAATRCYNDGIGYSRVVEDATTAIEILQDILKQIDGIMYEDEEDGLIKIKLVRNDYNPADCLEINPDNCEDFESPAIGGWTGIPNKLTIEYTSRENNYNTATLPKQNPANAVGQDGQEVEVRVSFPGCCTAIMADILGTRELQARSRPISKLTAVVDRSFDGVKPGDVLAVSWPKYGWDRLLFRVAGAPSRGTLADGKIRIPLIQEYFQSYRGTLRDPSTGIGGTLVHSGGIGG